MVEGNNNVSFIKQLTEHYFFNLVRICEEYNIFLKEKN